MWKRGEVAALIARSFPVISRSFLTMRAAVMLPGEGVQAGRLVVVVPKHIGTAPVRNRCKRRIRALTRQHLYALPYDIIVFVRRSCATLPAAELTALFVDAHAALTTTHS